MILNGHLGVLNLHHTAGLFYRLCRLFTEKVNYTPFIVIYNERQQFKGLFEIFAVKVEHFMLVWQYFTIFGNIFLLLRGDLGQKIM